MFKMRWFWLGLPALLLAGGFAQAAGLNAESASATEAPVARPKEATGHWLRDVRQALEAGEYHVTWSAQTGLPELPAAYQAPNRAQNLRTYFAPQGALLVARREAEPTWSVKLGLKAIGRGSAFEPAGTAKIVTQDQRVEYRRSGLTEWYLNAQRGLEHGFVIDVPPAGHGDLVLGLDTGAAALEGTGVNAVTLLADTGVPVLRYSDLKAYANDGRELASTLAMNAGAIELRVVAMPADYPVTVKSLATTVSWTAESDQTSSQFALSVAAAGDVNGDGYADVVVGAPAFDGGLTDEGRAFVYLGSAAGLSASAAWTAEGNQSAASFGTAVASAGDVNGDGYADLLVGASRFDNGSTNEGQAFVYLGGASGLSASAAWTAQGNQANAELGTSVASAGDVNGDGYADVIIGAPLFDNLQIDEGRAFVYFGGASGLSASAVWTAESNQTAAEFGGSVASAGDVNGDGYADVIVGAERFTLSNPGEGRVTVYHGSATGLPPVSSWSAHGGQTDANFGNSVASAGDVNGDGFADVVVGAFAFDNGEANEGRAVVYRGSASGLSVSAAWTAESNQASASFGFSVASAGDVNGDGYADVLVGAPSYDNGQSNEGRAFLYHGSASGLALNADWITESDQLDATFGYSVASAGDVNGDGYADAIVGARDYTNGQTREGRAFLYLGQPLGLDSGVVRTLEQNQANANLGIAVASAGDVNGDGYSDVIIGASTFDNGQGDEGRAFVYHGSTTGLPATANWSVESNQASALFGSSVASAGDVNGDGYADVIIGAYQFDNGETNEGRAFLYLGGASGLATTAAWTAEGNQASARFGSSVASAGDVNGDSYADVIVGAPDSSSGGFTQNGRARGYYGGPSGLSANAAWAVDGVTSFADLGWSLASAGDVNGDGYSDVIVGVPGFENAFQRTGGALIYNGGVSGLSASPLVTLRGGGNAERFGSSVASAGDVDGDGYADVIVGEPLQDNFGSRNPGAGAAYVYAGRPSGPSTAYTRFFASLQDHGNFGASVASAGDVNGDGYADVIIGAPFKDNGETDEGVVVVYYGSSSGLPTSPTGIPTPPSWTAEGNQVSANFGTSVASAGDVNGDGYADVLIGAPLHDNGEANEGQVNVYFGNAAGRSVRSQQRQGGASSALVSPWGYSQSNNSFRVSVNAISPVGRQRVKLQAEACPLGVPFGNVACTRSTQSTWTDVSASSGGTLLTHAISGLTNLAVYRWRARVLYAPFHVTAAGISAPANPTASPWRTLNAQAGIADIRIGGPADVAVSSGATNIANGATFDMGEVGINSTLTSTFTIANTGLRNLDFGSLSIVEPGGTQLFSLSAAPASPVVPGGSTTFQITYSPAGNTLRTANLSFSNTDPDENPFSFQIQARGTLSDMSVNLAGLPTAASPGVPYSGTVQCSSVPTLDIALNATCSVTGLPAGLTLGTCTPATPVAALPSGGTISCPVIGTPTIVGVVTVTATTGASNERFTSNNTATSTISVNAPQEITVLGNGQVINDGDSTPSLSDHTDFGAVSATSGTVVRTYTITNIGTATLSLGALTISGSHAADFSVIVLPAASIAAGGGSTSFQISFDPSGAGLRTASVSLVNNDTDENPFNFSIQGTGTNAAPTMTNLPNQTILEDGNTSALAITVGDAETPAEALQLVGFSSNPTLLPAGNIVFGGSGANRTLTLTPTANRSGTATITLLLTDGITETADDVVLTVSPVNDAPVLGLGTVANHPAGTTGAQTQSGFAIVDLGPPDEDTTQTVADFLIDNVSDPGGILLANSLDIANNGTLTYTLTGAGGTASITTRVRDNGGTLNGGVDTSVAAVFSISVGPSADLQIAITNNRSVLLNGEQTLYAIVIANNGPSAVTAATVSNSLPATLINASWMCVPAQSTATCPSPSAGTGSLNTLVNLGVNQFLRFDLLTEVNGAVGAFVANTVTVIPPPGTNVLNPGDDSATDQDPIAPEGVYADGFESTSTLLTMPAAKEALDRQ